MSSRSSLVLAAEAGLALLTLVVVLGMQRLFDGGGWLAPLLLNAVAAHLAVTVLRRRGLSLPLAAAAMSVAAAFVTSWTFYWSTTLAGIPTGDTWTAMRGDLSGAWTLYQDVVAPAPAQRGFLLASAVALWCIAYVADWAAFRLWVPFEASLPAGTLFLFTALLGSTDGQGWAVGTYAAALLLFMLLHRVARQDGSSHWVAERSGQGRRSLLAAGALLAGVAVLLGSVVGPMIPGAAEPGVIDARSFGNGTPPRVTISPLVDIRSRLVTQAATEVFEVRSSERAYWRLTSLDRFDGELWSSSGSFKDAGGPLPVAVPVETASALIEQRFTISGLSSIWLPSAYEPRAIEVTGVDVLYEDRSGTLIVDNDVSTSDGLTYQISSASPRLVADDLAARPAEVPGDIAEDYLSLPEDFSPAVAALAATLTAGASGPAEQALALQDHLRQFTYDLTVEAGHDDDALETFLLETQRGYCEQFAGSFAAMARSIGLPARVAVGFTTGEVDPTDPERYVVRGEHAHAWPEVYIAGAGWVAYEPTPGRGMPFAEPYTGVPEQQATTADPTTATTATPSTAPTIPSLPDGQGPPVDPDGGFDTSGDTPEDPARPDAPRSLPARALDLAAPVAAGVGLAIPLYLLGVPVLLVAHRWRRRRRAQRPAQQVDLAWTESSEVARLVGFREHPSSTYAERAHTLAALVPDVGPDLAVLLHALEVADYSAEGVSEEEAAGALDAAEAVEAAVLATADRSQRMRRWLDPRPLVTSWRSRRRAPQRRHITTTARGDLEVERELVGSADRR